MTEFIVALDGESHPDSLMYNILGKTKIRWFKVGPQAMTFKNWPSLIKPSLFDNGKIFLDLKLADTRDTVREAMKRFGDIGIAAVSTYTRAATEAAIEANTSVKVWQVVGLTDSYSRNLETRHVDADGIICPSHAVDIYQGTGIDIVVPGVRMAARGDDSHGHLHICYAQEAHAKGITHAVVGRPIWQAADPVATAIRYYEALQGNTL